jgi:hypothetical protein
MAKQADESDLVQLRAEIAMLRAQVQLAEDARKETEEQRNKHAAFLAWVALTAEEKTQRVADARFADRPDLGDWWEVQLPGKQGNECPRVRVRAHSDHEAIGRYREVCGILGTEHPFVAAVMSAG